MMNRPLVDLWKSVPALFVGTIGAGIKESSLYTVSPPAVYGSYLFYREGGYHLTENAV